jgi:hypothetical protein
MSVSKEEIQKLSPYQERKPISQACTHCGANTRPKINNIPTSVPGTVVQEAHWVCGRCNNRFLIGRVPQ